MTDPHALIHPKTLGRFRMRPLEEGRDWIVDPATGCWEWQGHKFKGYARCTAGAAYRELWRQLGHPLDDGCDLHHRCKNPGCVNPAHLEPTPRVAHLRMHKQEDGDLSWDDVRELREAYARGGASIQELGEQYGLGKSQVHYTVTNVKWHDPSFTPGRVIVCALDECGVEFIAGRSHQRFCCPDHKKRYTSRRGWRRRNGKPLEGPSRWRGAKDAA